MTCNYREIRVSHEIAILGTKNHKCKISKARMGLKCLKNRKKTTCSLDTINEVRVAMKKILIVISQEQIR